MRAILGPFRRFAAVLVLGLLPVVAVDAAPADPERAQEQWARALRRLGLDPESIRDPLAVTEEMQQAARRAAGFGTPNQRLRNLHRFLFDGERFTFDYESTGTHTAIEAYERREGNCVSFTTLFIALARSQGLRARPALLEWAGEFERVGDLLVVNEHLVAAHPSAGGSTVYDFHLTRRDPVIGLKVIDELWLAGIHQNNHGAVALAAGRLPEARRSVEAAVVLAPRFPSAWSNLGVIRRKSGDTAGAFEAYRTGLREDPSNAKILGNLAALYESQGLETEARNAFTAAERRNAPYLLLIEGDFEMRAGHPERAVRLYRKAARMARSNADVQISVARALLQLDDRNAARAALERALGLDPDSTEAAELLAGLNDSQGQVPSD